jgi:GNAT superfamily N-acetyltransferase
MPPHLASFPSSKPTEERRTRAGPRRPADPAGRSAVVSTRLAVTPAELALHHRIRTEVFVREQRFFHPTDRDARDEEPRTLRGLAVLPAHRRHRIGAPLVRFAVRAAGDRGGRLMVAHVQPRNADFFERLGWRRLGEPVEYVGHVHQRMAIDLRPTAGGSG